MEYSFTVGSTHDIDGLRQMPLAFSAKSTLLADSAYTDYALDDETQTYSFPFFC